MSEAEDRHHDALTPDAERPIGVPDEHTTDEEAEVLAELDDEDEGVPGVQDVESVPEAEEEAALRLRQQRP